MSQKVQKVLKVNVPKNMYYTLLQTKILQEQSNANLMVAMEHSVLLTPEECITTIFTKNCSLESTQPRTVDLRTRTVDLRTRKVDLPTRKVDLPTRKVEL